MIHMCTWCNAYVLCCSFIAIAGPTLCYVTSYCLAMYIGRVISFVDLFAIITLTFSDSKILTLLYRASSSCIFSRKKSVLPPSTADDPDITCPGRSRCSTRWQLSVCALQRGVCKDQPELLQQIGEHTLSPAKIPGYAESFLSKLKLAFFAVSTLSSQLHRRSRIGKVLASCVVSFAEISGM